MQLCEKDIIFCDELLDKDSALIFIAARLTEAGYVTAGYLEGMRAREDQISTFLGNGIAIPHGTTETRDTVLHTGVSVVVFRQGIAWGDDNIAYVVFGIAARTNEHLDILRQLTHVLSDESVPERIVNAQTPSDILALFNGRDTREDIPEGENVHAEVATFVIRNPHGLHARPAALLVKTAKKFLCNIRVQNLDTQSGIVDAKNLMRVVSLGAKNGHRLRFSACGSDALSALENIGLAIGEGLGEITTLPVTLPLQNEKRSWLSRLFS
ncbi:HPr family phosphocarrier protein [Rahnella selenatireducens]|uniref:HPr family phosphocarrier protein n=1 Tax=Rahnella selenatireducens TaxID=3389797 RepID=UPI0039696D61